MLASALGAVDLTALVGLGITTVTINSRAIPPLVIPIGGVQSSPPDPAMAALLQKVQPEVVLSGPLGEFHIAPYGTPDGLDPIFTAMGTELEIGLAALAVGLFALGYFLGRP